MPGINNNKNGFLAQLSTRERERERERIIMVRRHRKMKAL